MVSSHLNVATNQQLRVATIQFLDHAGTSDLETFWSNLMVMLCVFLESISSHLLSTCRFAIPRLLSIQEVIPLLDFSLLERLHRLFSHFRDKYTHFTVVPTVAHTDPWTKEAQEDNTTQECVRLLLGYDQLPDCRVQQPQEHPMHDV